MEARILRKGLVVAVILLFIGVAFAIPINANVSKSRFELDYNMKILEEDDIEKSSEEDCGCEDYSSTLEWNFTIICNLMFFPFIIINLYYTLRGFFPFMHSILEGIGVLFNCFWADRVEEL